jgi:hypothetical protein
MKNRKVWILNGLAVLAGKEKKKEISNFRRRAYRVSRLSCL